MQKHLLPKPTPDEMYAALCRRDSKYEGIFFFGVWTTGVFCRPTCPARNPKRDNISFYPKASDALAAGFRPCKRCEPMEAFGAAPTWMKRLLIDVERDPSHRWTDAELRECDIDPTRVRRWFKKNHGLTFHGYLRARRLGTAMGQINSRNQSTTHAALANGYESLSGFNEAFKKWFGKPPSAAKTLGVIQLSRVLTPLGPMVIAANNSHLVLLEFADRRMLETQLKRIQTLYQATFTLGSNHLIEQTETELSEYFSDSRNEFTVPIEYRGTAFQMSVWKQLCLIPTGTTISYTELARKIGKPKAQRAVGRANGDNRLAIIIPCHRVVRDNGTLSGYGGGVWRKQWLLNHEQQSSLS